MGGPFDGLGEDGPRYRGQMVRHPAIVILAAWVVVLLGGPVLLLVALRFIVDTVLALRMAAGQ